MVASEQANSVESPRDDLMMKSTHCHTSRILNAKETRPRNSRDPPKHFVQKNQTPGTPMISEIGRAINLLIRLCGKNLFKDFLKKRNNPKLIHNEKSE